jgi:hypothetical protein
VAVQSWCSALFVVHFTHGDLNSLRIIKLL